MRRKVRRVGGQVSGHMQNAPAGALHGLKSPLLSRKAREYPTRGSPQLREKRPDGRLLFGSGRSETFRLAPAAPLVCAPTDFKTL